MLSEIAFPQGNQISFAIFDLPQSAQAIWRHDLPMSREHAHTPQDMKRRLTADQKYSPLKDMIYGGIDGAVTTFAIVAGVAGAGLSHSIIVALGLANILADGFSMAASNYSGTKAELDDRRRTVEIEERHISEHPEGEREELRQILALRGLSGSLLDQATDAIAQNKEKWIAMMLTDEYGLARNEPNPGRAALATFVAFMLAGSVPLVPFVLGLPNPFALLCHIVHVFLDRCGQKPVVFVEVVAVWCRDTVHWGDCGPSGLRRWGVVPFWINRRDFPCLPGSKISKGWATMFANSVKLFSIARFDIKVDPSWLVIAALITWTLSQQFFPNALPGQSPQLYVVMALLGMLGLFVSLLFHELAHSVVARRLGVPIKSDLREVCTNTLTLLKRTIGATYRIKTDFADDLDPVMIDPPPKPQPLPLQARCAKGF